MNVYINQLSKKYFFLTSLNLNLQTQFKILVKFEDLQLCIWITAYSAIAWNNNTIQRLSNKSIWDLHKVGYLHQAPGITPVKKKILLIFALISVTLYSHTYQEIHNIQLLSSGLLVC